MIGRWSDILKIGYSRTSAIEIEVALLELECVFEVAVIGIEDDILGKAVKTFITKNSVHD